MLYYMVYVNWIVPLETPLYFRHKLCSIGYCSIICGLAIERTQDPSPIDFLLILYYVKYRFTTIWFALRMLALAPLIPFHLFTSIGEGAGLTALHK